MQIIAVFISRWIPRNELIGYLPMLSSNKALRLERLHRDEDFLRGFLGDLLIRHVVRRCIDLDDGVLDFATGEFGKPFLSDYPSVHFNLSHSGSWVVCALDQHPIGIDVERIAPVDLEISNRFFSTAEQRQIIKKSPRHRLDEFINLWTLKESYLKMTGKGISQPMNDFSVLRSDSGELKIYKDNRPVEGIFLALSDQFKQHKIAICAHTQPTLESVEVILMEQLLTA